jgi:hypothetical protein
MGDEIESDLRSCTALWPEELGTLLGGSGNILGELRLDVEALDVLSAALRLLENSLTSPKSKKGVVLLTERWQSSGEFDSRYSIVQTPVIWQKE